MRPRLIKSWANAKMAKAFRYPVDRATVPGYILDVQDANIWQTKRETFGETRDNKNEWIYNLAVAMSGDAADFKGASLTPILIRILNLPPWVRDRAAQVMMTLLLPKGVKWQGCLAPLWWELTQWGPSGPGFRIHDAHVQAAAICRVWLAFSQVRRLIVSSPSYRHAYYAYSYG